MKKVIKILLAILGLLVLVAVVAPFVIDVNSYRPSIEKAANEKLNGKLSLGKITLNLWGQIKLAIDGLKLEDSQGRPVVEVKDAAIQIPVLSIISGSPNLRLVLDRPGIHVVKNSEGKINLLELIKSKGMAADTNGGAKDQAGASGSKDQGGETKLPALVLRSKLTFLIEHAKLEYRDDKAGSRYDVSDFSFHLNDVSPTSKMPFDAEAQLNLAMGAALKVVGPLKLNGELKANGPQDDLFGKLDGKLAIVFDDLDISNDASFQKKKGVPLRIETVFSMDKEGINVPKLTFRIADVSIDGRAATKTQGAVTMVDAQMQSNRIDVAKLGALAPSISENGLNGIVELNAKANGPSDRLNYNAGIKFNDVNIKTESTVKPVNLNGNIEVATNELKSLNVVFKSEGLDGTLTGSVVNFSKPSFRFGLNAKEIDLDKVLVKSTKTTSQSSDGQSQGAGSEPAKAPKANSNEDANASLNALKQNPVAAQANGTFDLNIQMLKSSNVVLRNLRGQLAMNNLLMQLKALSFNLFDGTFKTDASINAKGSIPELGMNLEINNLNTQRMAESQMTFAKNTVKGIVSARMNLGGKGLNRSEINSGWRGNGQFTLKDASFSSIDIGKQIKTGLIDKLPDMLKSKVRIKDSLLDWHGDYSALVAKFNLQNGTLQLADLDGKAVENKGMDLKGSGHVSIVDYSMDLNCDFIDRYQLLGQGMPKDKRYNAPAISAHLTGSLSSPKYDWGHTLEQLAKSAASDTLKEKGRDTLKKQVENLGVPEGAKNLLKGLFN